MANTLGAFFGSSDVGINRHFHPDESGHERSEGSDDEGEGCEEVAKFRFGCEENEDRHKSDENRDVQVLLLKEGDGTLIYSLIIEILPPG